MIATHYQNKTVVQGVIGINNFYGFLDDSRTYAEPMKVY